jgi:TonB family protein
MRTFLLLAVMSAFAVSGNAQNFKFQLPERQTPVVSKERLNNANTLNDISPMLWSSMYMSYDERYLLEHRRPEVFPQPKDFLYPQENYSQIITVQSVQISVTSNGETMVAKSTDEKLSAEQKKLLTNADMGSNIRINFKYKYKDQSPDKLGSRSQLVEVHADITVVPETEAEFPGGYKQLSNYLAENVIGKTSDPKAAEQLGLATIVFTVSENGDVVSPTIARSTQNGHLDQLLLDALYKMPRWKPAVDSKGAKVKQEFVIPFNVGC